MNTSDESPLIAGVELGDTKCICLLASGPGRILDEVRLPTLSPDETLPAIRAVLQGWRDGPGFAAVGIASFGPLELDRRSSDYGRLKATPKSGWSGANPLSIAEGFHAPVSIDTDVNGAALAEGRWGAAQGLSSHAYITVGTGVGVGLIINGSAVRGLGHAEAGHLRVGRLTGDVWPGTCPYHGDCVEGLVSGPALAERTGRSAADLDPDHPAWESVVQALAGLLHNLVLTGCPERILIGGGVVQGQPWLFPRLRPALVDSLGGYGAADRVAAAVDRFLQPPELGTRAGPLGAIALALEAISGRAR